MLYIIDTLYYAHRTKSQHQPYIPNKHYIINPLLLSLLLPLPQLLLPLSSHTHLDTLVGLEVLIWLCIELSELLGQIGADVAVHLFDALGHLQGVLSAHSGETEVTVLLVILRT